MGELLFQIFLRLSHHCLNQNPTNTPGKVQLLTKIRLLTGKHTIQFRERLLSPLRCELAFLMQCDSSEDHGGRIRSKPADNICAVPGIDRIPSLFAVHCLGTGQGDKSHASVWTERWGGGFLLYSPQLLEYTRRNNPGLAL